MKQSNFHFSYSIEIDRDIGQVWELLIRVAEWSKWDTELSEAVIFGVFQNGARGELIPKRGPKLSFQITDYNEGNYYVFSTKLPFGYLVIRRELISIEGVTRFTDDIKFTGVLRRLYGVVLGRGFKAVIPDVMLNFKNLLEKSNS